MKTFIERNQEKFNIWKQTRAVLELDNYRHKRYGGRSKSHWTLFEHLVHVFGYGLKFAGLYNRGKRNASNIRLKQIDYRFTNLPLSFDGYKILYFTDLHFDNMPGMEDLLLDKISRLSYDICLFTGDYREKIHGGFGAILAPLRKLVSGINCHDGIFSTLGNHDSYLMVDYLEAMDISVVANETLYVSRGKDMIAFTGIDDAHSYFTDQAIVAFNESFAGFKIVFSHTPELIDVAADAEYDLYLCGHTHGGQIALLWGIPIITHLYSYRKFYAGNWHYKNMQGYTSCGCGTVAIPIRFNTEPEITLITLRKN